MKNCIILEIRDRSEQVVFAAEDRNDGDEGVAKLFTKSEAAQEIDRLNREWPHFRFQIVTLNLL